MTSREQPRSAYLEAFRETIATPATARTRNRAAIEARLARGSEVGDAAPHELGDEPAPTAGWSQRAAGLVAFAKPVALSVGLATAGLGAIKGGSMTVRALQSTRPDASAPAVEIEPAAPAKAAEKPPRPRPPAPPPPAAAALPSPPAIASGEAPRPVRPPSAPRPIPAASPRDDAPKRPPVDRLGQETALMRRAKAQLDREDWDTLLQTLAQHEREFGAGVLEEEREAWGTIARCKVGRGDAPALAAGFAQRYPSSALVRNVRKACVDGAR